MKFKIKSYLASLLLPLVIMLIMNRKLWMFLLLVISFICFMNIRYETRGTRSLAIKVEEVSVLNKEFLFYILLYIFLIFIPYKPLFIIGFGLYAFYSDFYMYNPLLKLLGYNFYLVKTQFGENVVFCKGVMTIGDGIEVIQMDDKLWFAKIR